MKCGPFCERYTLMFILNIMATGVREVYTMYIQQIAENLLYITES
jgi:hypothetical protein